MLEGEPELTLVLHSFALLLRSPARAVDFFLGKNLGYEDEGSEGDFDEEDDYDVSHQPLLFPLTVPRFLRLTALLLVSFLRRTTTRTRTMRTTTPRPVEETRPPPPEVPRILRSESSVVACRPLVLRSR
jgi:hypothetical protein